MTAGNRIYTVLKPLQGPATGNLPAVELAFRSKIKGEDDATFEKGVRDMVAKALSDTTAKVKTSASLYEGTFLCSSRR